MKQSLCDKWCEKLCSGEYEQGKHKLRSPDDKFCCWGVLCDIIDPSKWVQEDVRLIGSQYTYDDSALMISDELATELGVDIDNITGRLAGMNDSGYTFPEIAEQIREIVPVEDDTILSPCGD